MNNTLGFAATSSLFSRVARTTKRKSRMRRLVARYYRSAVIDLEDINVNEEESRMGGARLDSRIRITILYKLLFRGTRKFIRSNANAAIVISAWIEPRAALHFPRRERRRRFSNVKNDFDPATFSAVARKRDTLNNSCHWNATGSHCQLRKHGEWAVIKFGRRKKICSSLSVGGSYVCMRFDAHVCVYVYIECTTS